MEKAEKTRGGEIRRCNSATPDAKKYIPKGVRRESVSENAAVVGRVRITPVQELFQAFERYLPVRRALLTPRKERRGPLAEC